jgi:uroporphyrinogen decarboxylase
MTLKEVIVNQINHIETKPVPFTLGFEGDVAMRLDQYYGNTEWRKKLIPYMANIGAVYTMTRTRIDDIREQDPYGVIWRMDRRPWYLEKAPLDKPSLEGYKFPTPESFFNPQIKETARQVCENHKDKFLVGGLGWGLFEISWSLRGFENILMDSVIEPDFYEELLDRLMDLYLAFVDYTCDLPIDAIMFGDDWGDQRGIILGPELWRKFLKPRWAKIYDAVHAKGKYVISHSCGSVVDVIPDLIEMGLDVLESVQPEARGMNPYELKKKFGDKITFWGCLGTQEILPYGTPDDIKKEIKRLCVEMGRGGGFILSPAKPLQPETSAENAAAVLEAFTNQET